MLLSVYCVQGGGRLRDPVGGGQAHDRVLLLLAGGNPAGTQLKLFFLRVSRLILAPSACRDQLVYTIKAHLTGITV